MFDCITALRVTAPATIKKRAPLFFLLRLSVADPIASLAMVFGIEVQSLLPGKSSQ